MRLKTQVIKTLAVIDSQVPHPTSKNNMFPQCINNTNINSRDGILMNTLGLRV